MRGCVHTHVAGELLGECAAVMRLPGAVRLMVEAVDSGKRLAIHAPFPPKNEK